MKKNRTEIPLFHSEVFESGPKGAENDFKLSEKVADELRPTELLSVITEKSLPRRTPEIQTQAAPAPVATSTPKGALGSPSRAPTAGAKPLAARAAKPSSLMEALLEFHRSQHPSKRAEAKPASQSNALGKPRLESKATLDSMDRIEVNSNFYRPRGARTILRPKT